jgi:ABC-type dipeptide/oligopeptide/nickel transport system permease component
MGYFSPTDPIKIMLGQQHFDPRIYAQLRHAYGLDLPWYQQYANLLIGLLHFNLGLSITQPNREVWDILREGVPISLELGFWALVIQYMVGLLLGVLSAVKANTWVDTTNMAVLLVLYTVPAFIVCVFLQSLIVWIDQSTAISWPVAGWGVPWQYSWSDLQHKLLPILIVAVSGIAYIARLTRTGTLETLQQDFVRTARAKGLLERRVIFLHALRNSLIPVGTTIGLSFGFLVVGDFFIERIFSIPGIGYITLLSATAYDYPVIQATAILLATGVVLGNLISDLLYRLIDPRIKIA